MTDAFTQKVDTVEVLYVLPDITFANITFFILENFSYGALLFLVNP